MGSFNIYRYWTAPGMCDYPQGVDIGPPKSYVQQSLEALNEQLGKQGDVIREQDRRIDYLEKELKNRIEHLEEESNRKIEYLERELERMKEKYKDCQNKN